tara:strand:- start:842 stop:1114 length:273 start_codon:yes stop_codon:yes gene_type:complete
MRYLIFNDDAGAESRSEELWKEQSGTDGDDGTRFLYLTHKSESEGGGSIMMVDDDGELLSSDERDELGDVGDERYEEWIAENLSADDPSD